MAAGTITRTSRQGVRTPWTMPSPVSTNYLTLSRPSSTPGRPPGGASDHAAAGREFITLLAPSAVFARLLRTVLISLRRVAARFPRLPDPISLPRVAARFPRLPDSLNQSARPCALGAMGLGLTASANFSNLQECRCPWAQL